jgi:hypothetical protein
MGNQDARAGFTLHLLAQKRQHLLRGLRVEVAGGLVGEQEQRPVHEGARDRDALHLAARKLARIGAGSSGEPHRGEHLEDARPRLRGGHAVERKGQGDVLRDREMGQQVERLEHEADARPAQQRARSVIERRDVPAFEDDAAAVRGIEPRDQVEKRGLADSGLADDGDVFAVPDFERDAAQQFARPRAAVGLAQIADDQHGAQRTLLGRR